ncbi:MAG: hypothetical protein ACR2NU_06685 [Aeoliella sp.]
MSKNQRGKEYIDPQVQGALWRRLITHWLAYIAVAAVLALGLEWMNDPFRPLDQVASQAWWTYSPMLLIMLFLMPAFIYDSIRLSHRFAGPVFRIRQVIKHLAAGEQPKQIEFRDNDFWKEIAEDVNRVIDRLGDAPVAAPEQPTAS